MTNTSKHIPVLLDAVLRISAAKKGETLLDVTAGYGGHASAILGRTLQDEGSVLVDRDEHATKELSKRFKGRGLRILQQNFADATRSLEKEGQQFDIILADLGVSSPHLDNIDRGFSFAQEGPLDMRMDESQTTTAGTIVNKAKRDELIRILREYGEEPRAVRIADAIIKARPLLTTTELAKVVERTLHRGWQRTHPATKTFQALRIAVNDELGQLEAALPLWLELLKPGGRLVVISFHSLEDRIVKRFLGEVANDHYDAQMQLLTKKPISATSDELVLNPRARSAKLRAAVKIKTQKEGELH